MNDEQQAEERGPVSWEAWNWMRHEISRLQAENEQLRRDNDYWREETNRWYMKANYTPQQIAEFVRRRSASMDPETGEWIPIDALGDAE